MTTDLRDRLLDLVPALPVPPDRLAGVGRRVRRRRRVMSTLTAAAVLAVAGAVAAPQLLFASPDPVVPAAPAMPVGVPADGGPDDPTATPDVTSSTSPSVRPDESNAYRRFSDLFTPTPPGWIAWNTARDVGAAPGGPSSTVTLGRTPSGTQARVDYLELSGPGDTGLLEIYIGSQKVFQYNLASIRQYDVHPGTPLEVRADQEVTARITCAARAVDTDRKPLPGPCGIHVVVSGSVQPAGS